MVSGKSPSLRRLQAETVIVGGGITGCSVAYFLTRYGCTDLVLLEREALASGATGICPGGIRQQFEGEADCRLARRAYSFWCRINRILEPEEPFRFEQSGYVFLADSRRMLERFRSNVLLQNRLGIPSRLLSPQELGELLPALNLRGVQGASFCPQDGFLEDCHGVTTLLARRACQRGLRILFEEALQIVPSGGGWEVLTRDSLLRCRHLVLAAALNTLELTRPLGLELPLRAEPRRLAFTLPHQEILLPPLLVAPERQFAGKQLSYGVFYLGWMGERESHDDLLFIERVLSAGATLLPALGEVPVRRVLRGAYDTTPDHRPILGPVTGFPGLFLAVGFSGHGFMLAPAVGEGLARLILNREEDPLLRAFSLERFQGGVRGEGLVI